MMNIGLIGSTAFYNTYKQELIKDCDVIVFGKCSITDALNNTLPFESLLNECQYLFFEEINSASFQLVIAGLKNGKNIVIDAASVSMEEMNEMHKISNEGNLKCMIFNSPDYYKLFEPLKDEIKNPFFVEMMLEYGDNKGCHLSDNISTTLYKCMQHLLHIFKSDIKQINVKPLKIFSPKTDFISIQLDFSNGCSANIKMSEMGTNSNHTINIYQHSNLFTINLSEKRTERATTDTHGLKTICINASEINIIEKKICHFFAVVNNTKTHTDSILDNYLALELSSKIIKKINSLYE